MREEGLDMNVDMWGTEATAAYGDGSLVSVCTGGWFGGFLKTDYARMHPANGALLKCLVE